MRAQVGGAESAAPASWAPAGLVANVVAGGEPLDKLAGKWRGGRESEIAGATDFSFAATATTTTRTTTRTNLAGAADYVTPATQVDARSARLAALGEEAEKMRPCAGSDATAAAAASLPAGVRAQLSPSEEAPQTTTTTATTTTSGRPEMGADQQQQQRQRRRLRGGQPSEAANRHRRQCSSASTSGDQSASQAAAGEFTWLTPPTSVPTGGGGGGAQVAPSADALEAMRATVNQFMQVPGCFAQQQQQQQQEQQNSFVGRPHNSANYHQTMAADLSRTLATNHQPHMTTTATGHLNAISNSTTQTITTNHTPPSANANYSPAAADQSSAATLSCLMAAAAARQQQQQQQQQRDLLSQFSNLHSLSAVASAIQHQNQYATSAAAAAAAAATTTTTPTASSQQPMGFSHFAPAVAHGHLQQLAGSGQLVQPFATAGKPTAPSLLGRSQTQAPGRPPGRKRRGARKCRKVYGMAQRPLWCTQCKWKKACSRFTPAAGHMAAALASQQQQQQQQHNHHHLNHQSHQVIPTNPILTSSRRAAANYHKTTRAAAMATTVPMAAQSLTSASSQSNHLISNLLDMSATFQRHLQAAAAAAAASSANTQPNFRN